MQDHSTHFVVQTVNFLVLASSLLICINNVMDLDYKLNTLDSMEYIVSTSHSICMILASFMILFMSITSPLSKDYNYWFEKELRFERLIYNTFVLYSATTSVVEDPSLLFTWVDGDVHEDGVMSDIGSFFIKGVNIAKLIMLISGVFYGISYIILHHESYKNRSNEVIGRVVLFCLWVFTLSVFVSNIVLAEKDSLLNARRYSKAVYDYHDHSWWMEPITHEIISDISMSLVLLQTLYILFYYDTYRWVSVKLFIVGLNNIDRMTYMHIDNGAFSATVLINAFLLSTIVAIVSKYNFKEFVHKKFLIDLLYKCGCILCTISLLFFAICVFYDWMNIKFTPHKINVDFSANIDIAEVQLDHVLQTLGDIAVVLDPCTKKQFKQTNDVTVLNSLSELDNTLKDARRRLHDRGDALSSMCVQPNDPFELVKSDECKKVENDYENIKNTLTEEFENNIPPSKEYSPAHFDEETFVDKECRRIQCETLTAVTLAAGATSWVPFFSGVSEGAAMAARAAFKVFKIGRRITKFFPRMRKIRNSIRKLANSMKRLVRATYTKTKYETKQFSLFLPGLILSLIVVSTVMIKREPAQYTSLIENKGTQLAFSLYLPLTIGCVTIYISTLVLPTLLENVLDALPKAFVSASMEIQMGFRALQIAYLLNSLGGICLATASILYTGVSCVGNFFKSTSRIDNFIQRTNVNNNYVQPLLVLIPAIYLSIKAVSLGNPYFDITYSASTNISSFSKSLSNTLLQTERSEHFHFDFDELNCGIVGKIVKELLHVIPGDFVSILGDLFSEFTNGISIAFDSVEDFLNVLKNLVDFEFLHLDLPDVIIPHGLVNWVLFAIPIFSVIALLLLSVIKVYRNNSLPKLTMSMCSFILNINMFNIVCQNSIKGTLESILSVEVPFVQIQTVFSDSIFDSILASIFCIISIFVIFLNNIAPAI